MKQLISVFLAIACVAVAPTSHSDDLLEGVRVVAGASLGYSNLSFPEKLDHDLSFPTSNLLLAAVGKRWQVSLNAAVSLQDADISEEEDVGKASREDYDLTLGYQLTRNWGIFGGYKSGETDMQFTSRDSEDEGVAINVDEKYEQDGPFIGSSYTWFFEKAGRLTVSLAYAELDGVNDFRANTDDDEEDEAPEFDDLTGRVRSDVMGFSYVLAWSVPLSSKLLFQTRFKVNDYKQDLTVEGVDFDDIDETFSSLHVGLAYVF